MRRIGFLLGGLLVGCAQVSAATGTATLRATADGSPISGTAHLTETPQGLAITIEVANVPPGRHGLHIHEHGDCGSGGQAAGGHYNPDSVKHGYLPTDGLTAAHAGDLGNIEVDVDGTGILSLTVAGLTLSGGPYAVEGHAIILHEQVDNFGQPVGNAGGRIGCGVIEVN